MICIGNSHLACVLAAADKLGVPLTPIVLKESRYFRGLPRVEVLQPSQLAERLADKDDLPIYSFVGGTRHLAASFRRNPRPYDLFLPDAPELPVEEGAEIVPAAAVRTALAKSMVAHLRALDVLTDVAQGRVVHFEPPPPPAIRWFETEVRDRRADSHKFAPYLRYKLWRLNSEIVREHVARGGGTFVESPRATHDEEGFLRSEFVGNSTHANAAYGALVLEQMQVHA